MKSLEDVISHFNNVDILKDSIAIYYNYDDRVFLYFTNKKDFESLTNAKIDNDKLKKGINLLDVIHEDDIDLFSIPDNKDKKYKKFKLTFRMLDSNNKFIIIKGSFKKINEHNIKKYIVYKTELFDVRSLYEKNKDISVTKRNFDALMEDTRDFIFFKDANHVMTAASDSLARITGHKKGYEIVGKIDYELFPKEYADVYFKLEKDIYNGDLPYIEEVQPIIDENGEEGWVANRKAAYKNKKGEIVGIFGIARIVTENERNKKLIAEQKKLLERAEEVSHLGHWSYDIVKDKLQWSEEVYRIFEVYRVDNEELSYDFFLRNIHPDDMEDVNKAYKESLINKKNYEIIHRLLFDDERVKYIQEKIEHNVDENGNIISSFGTTLDITNLKEYENEIKQKDEMLISQSRSAAMGEMINMIAHQWRQPLSAISMNVNNILLDIDLGDFDEKSVKDLSNNILEQTQHLSKTIDDFKNYFSQEKSKEQVSIDQFLKDCVKIIDVSLKHYNIDLIIENSSDTIVTIYKSELIQVLLNLINNSKDAFITNDITERKITISTEENDNSIKIHVSDNAGGIDKFILDKIFDPYFTTKTNFNGTGIGLYMSKMIVEKHIKGKLLVENIKDGVCFSVEIPKDK